MLNLDLRLYILLVLFIGCTSTEVRYSCHCDNGTEKPIYFHNWEANDFRSISSLQLVEVVGYYRFGSEESAIYKDRSSFEKHIKSNAVWLTFDGSCLLGQDSARKFLIKSPKELSRITGKKITVLGVIDTTNTGHLNQYKATIGKICLFQYED
jgi:hypothetical protein